MKQTFTINHLNKKGSLLSSVEVDLTLLLDALGAEIHHASWCFDREEWTVNEITNISLIDNDINGLDALINQRPVSKFHSAGKKRLFKQLNIIWKRVQKTD